MNKFLVDLDLNYVRLSDGDVLLLADALHEHSKLSKLGLMDCNSFQNSLFMQSLQKVSRFASRSCLSEVHVDGLQYHPVKQQLEIYQASRQQKCLMKLDLRIATTEMPILQARERIAQTLENSLLTGE